MKEIQGLKKLERAISEVYLAIADYEESIERKPSLMEVSALADKDLLGLSESGAKIRDTLLDFQRLRLEILRRNDMGPMNRALDKMVRQMRERFWQPRSDDLPQRPEVEHLSKRKGGRRWINISRETTE